MKKQKFQVANEATTAAVETVEIENGTPETTPTAAAEHTPEAPTQKAETIEELQQRLDVELARLSHKRQLANNRQKFIIPNFQQKPQKIKKYLTANCNFSASQEQAKQLERLKSN